MPELSFPDQNSQTVFSSRFIQLNGKIPCFLLASQPLCENRRKLEEKYSRISPFCCSLPMTACRQRSPSETSFPLKIMSEKRWVYIIIEGCSAEFQRSKL